MNTYEAFYRGKQITVQAATSYEAQQRAAEELRAKKRWEVTVILSEKDGEAVVHDPAILGS